ncbi:MAG: response regulator [Balneolales bacterium]
MDNELEILLVEDNMSDAELAIRALNKKNLYNPIVHLKDGSEAVNYLFGKEKYSDRDLSIKPKVILLDLKMPKIDGIEVLRRIKLDENTKTIPVVILTSSNEDPDIKRCYELGANSYIVKPVEFDSFLESVSEVGLYWMVINRAPK